MKEHWLRRATADLARRTADGKASRALGELAATGEFLTLTGYVQPRRLLASADVEAEDMQAVLTWLDTAG